MLKGDWMIRITPADPGELRRVEQRFRDSVARGFGFEAWELSLAPRPFHRPGKLCIDGHEYRRRRRARVKRGRR